LRRLLAAAWDLRGRRDSAARYYAQADSGLAVDISVTTAETSTPDSVSFDLAILAINRKALPARPIRLTFEFLDRQGAVRATRSMDLLEMPPTSTHPVDLHVSAKDLVGWRYRPT